MAVRTLSDLCELIFSGVLVKGSANVDVRRDRLALLRTKLTEEHFPDEPMRVLFRVICYYDDMTGEVIGEQELEDKLDGAADSGTAQLLIQMYRDYASRSVDYDVFVFSIEQVRERKAARETDQALITSIDILRKGVELPNGKELRGQKDARNFIVNELTRIDRDMSFQESPEGDMRTETDDMWLEYEKQKELNESGGFQGVKFGIDVLDESLGGLQPGDLALTLGYTSSGKTTLCVQLAWWAAVMQGINVVYVTTETLRKQVRRKVISRHSCLPMFNLGGGSDPQGRLLPGGLNSRDIRKARLSPKEMEAYRAVLDDMHNNPQYGSLDIVQMPSGGTMADAELRTERIGRTKKVGLVVIDYLELVRWRNPRLDKRVGLGENIRDAKEFATTFNDGNGVPVISPWQVTRKARDEAAAKQAYDLQSTSETAEASNTPDTIISVLEDLFNARTRISELSLASLKQRDGEILAPFKVDVDYATSSFSNAKAGGLFALSGSGGLPTLGLG